MGSDYHMKVRRQMEAREQPKFPDPPRPDAFDAIVNFLRHNKAVVALYCWLTDTLIPLFFAIVIVVPAGAVLMLFYLPKFYRNWQRRRLYGVKVRDETSPTVVPPQTGAVPG
jgi:hypothetical protein